MLVKKDKICYQAIPEPDIESAEVPTDLTDETMRDRKEKVLEKMKRERLDFLFIYADREHGGNFGYLTGFEPRFEEAVLVLYKDGQASLMLGNESLKMAQYARISNKAVKVPHFSLPNQPMETKCTVEELIGHAGVTSRMKGGVVGWKMFTTGQEDNRQLYDVPYFLVEALKRAVGSEGKIENRSDLFIHPSYGVRTVVNANEAAHFEYGASKAAKCIFNLMNDITEGITELKLADYLNTDGQPLSVQSICASGERFTNAVVAPRNKKVRKGEYISVTMGLRGGLTCRTGFVAEGIESLPNEQKEYVEQVVKPYFSALATWYSDVGIGTSAGEVYKSIEDVIPKNRYGWKLNPGHLTASEEWLSSPFYPASDIILKSGMMIQMDIIISVPGFSGVNAEDGILLADEELRMKISKYYPDVWKRMEKRRRYMKEVLGISISEEVLPMSGLCGYLRPYLLERRKAMCVRESAG